MYSVINQHGVYVGWCKKHKHIRQLMQERPGYNYIESSPPVLDEERRFMRMNKFENHILNRQEEEMVNSLVYDALWHDVFLLAAQFEIIRFLRADIEYVYRILKMRLRGSLDSHMESINLYNFFNTLREEV